jgi:hypothetical protein
MKKLPGISGVTQKRGDEANGDASFDASFLPYRMALPAGADLQTTWA